MSFLSFLRKLRDQLQTRQGQTPSRPSRRPGRRSRKVTLGLEPLETRINPVDNIWTGGGGVDNTWSNAANWTDGVPDDNDVLVFPTLSGVAAGDPRLSPRNDLSGRTLTAITISGKNYSISGNQITLGGPAGGNSLNVNGSATNNIISFDIEMGGLAGNRQFFTVDFGSDVTLTGSLKSPASTTSAELTKTGGGLLTLANDNSAFTGPVKVEGGVAAITNVNALGDVAPVGSGLDDIRAHGTTVAANAQLQIVGVDGTINEHLLLNGPGIANDGALLHVSGSAFWAGDVELDGNTTAPVTIGATGPFASGPFSSGKLTISGQISDTGAGHGLIKEGQGEIVLSNANSYRGLTTINNGILTIEDPLALGDGGTNDNGTVVNDFLAKTGTLRLNTSGTGFTVLDERLTLNGTGVGGLGALTNDLGENQWAGLVTLGSPPPNGSDVHIGVEQGGRLTISGVVRDRTSGSSLTLTKVDAGELVLTNDNLYEGSTNVLWGTLTVRDSHSLGPASGASTTVGSPEVQTVSIDTGTPVDTFRLTFASTSGTSTTAPLSVTSTPAQVQSVLNNLFSVFDPLGSVRVFQKNNVYTVLFLSSFDGVNQNQMTATPTGAATVTVNTVYEGGLSATLGLEIDAGFDPHGRDLGDDSETGVANKLDITELITIAGRGVGGKGALRNISGINIQSTGITLRTPTAAIGVDPDPTPSNSNLYFTNDYSLTSIGNITGPTSTTFAKVGTGQLILPFASTYTGPTLIEEGWVTARNNRALGGFIGRVGDHVFGDTSQPTTTVLAGAALHLKPLTPGTSLNLVENLVLSGNGISHPFSLMNQKGALMSLGGNNIVGGPLSNRSSTIVLNGNAGIGVELLGPDTQSELTITSTISDSAVGGITKFGTRRLTLQGDGSYRGNNTIAEGVVRVQHNQALGTASTGTSANGTNTYTTTTTTVGPGFKELQSLTLTGAAGSYQLQFNGQTTTVPGGLTFNSTAQDVQNALNALSTIGGVGGSVTVNRSGGGNFYTISFGGTFTGLNQPQLIPVPSGGIVVTPATLVEGDGAALQLGTRAAQTNGGVTSGNSIWYERLVIDSPRNAMFDSHPLTVLSNDQLWRGPVTLRRDTTVQVAPGTRAVLHGGIDDAGGASSGSGLTVAGGGVVNLAGNSSFAGTTVVTPGSTLVVQNSQALGGIGISEQQTITVAGSAGTFTLTFKGQTTDALPFDATAAQVQSALNGLSSIGAFGGNAAVTKAGNTYTVTLGGKFNGFDQPEITGSGLGGATLTFATTRQGGGGTIVLAGATLKLQGNLTIAGEPLELHGRGASSNSNVPVGWFAMGPNSINSWPGAGNQAVSGRVTGVVVDPIDPNVIYVGTAGGGAWKTKDGGKTWLPMFDYQNGSPEIQTLTVGGPGTYTLTFNGQTTAILSTTATAVQVQQALNNLASIGGVGGSVDVTLAGGVYTITFLGNLSGVNIATLGVTPVTGTAPTVGTTADGIASDAALHVGTITRDPIDPRIIYVGTGETNNSADSFYGTGIYRSIDAGINWTLVNGAQVQVITVTGTTGGFTLSFEGDTTGVLDNVSAGVPDHATAAEVEAALEGLSTIGAGEVTVSRAGIAEVQRLTVTATAGTYTLDFNGATATLAFNADAATIQTALNGLATIGGLTPAGSVTVASPSAGVFDITFGGSLGLFDQPAITVPGGGATVAQRGQGNVSYTVVFGGTLASREVPVLGATPTAPPDTTSVGVRLTNPFNPFDLKGISKIIVDPNDTSILYVASGDGGAGRNEVQRVTPNVPNNTTFTLTFRGADATGTIVNATTSPITFLTGAGNRAANAAAIQTALNNLTNIGGVGGFVTVTPPTGGGPGGNRYTITFGGSLSQTNVEELTANPPAPGFPSVSVSTTTQGGSGKVVNGTSGGAGVWRLRTSDAEQRITVNGTAGTFKITFNGFTTPFDPADPDLPYNATAAQVQTELNALPSIQAVGGVIVTLSGNVYTVRFRGQTPMPLMTAVGADGATPVVSELTAGGVYSWVNMTSVVSVNRSTVATTQAVPPAEGAFSTASASGSATIVNTPGPDDDYRMEFPQTNATWSDVALVYVDSNNTPTDRPRGAARPVIYASLGVGSGDVNNAVFVTNNPTSNAPIWYVGDPGGVFAGDADIQAVGAPDSRPAGFERGQFAIPVLPGGLSQPEVPRTGNIKLGVTTNNSNASSFNYAPGNYLNTTTVYASVANPNGTFKNLYRTTNGGATWATVTLPGSYMAAQGSFANAIHVVNNNTVYVAGYEANAGTHLQNIFLTTDGGGTWTDISVDPNGNGPHAGVHGMTTDSQNRLVVATDGGVWRREANGNWTNLLGNLNVSQINGVASHPTNLDVAYAGVQHNGTAVFDNNLDWTATDGAGGGQVRVDPKNPNFVYHVQLVQGAAAQIRKSTNGGATWTTVFQPGTTTARLTLDRIDPTRLLVGRSGFGSSDLMQSSDRGATFTALNAPTSVTALGIASFQGPFVNDSSFSLVTDQGANTYDPGTIYITDGSSVWITKNNGQSWSNRTNELAGEGAIADIFVDPTNRDTAYVVRNGFGGGHVFMTTDAGRSWTDISNNLPDLPAWKVVLDQRSGDLYVGTDAGVYWRKGGTTTWDRFGEGMPNVQVRDLELNQTTNTLLAGSYGRGVFQLFLNDGEAQVGALVASTGTSFWTGPVYLVGDASNQVAIAANGNQNLQTEAGVASLNIQGSVSDLIPGSNPRLLKVGGGDLILSAANTYGGVTEIQDGVLVVANPNALGSPAANTIVNDGTALELLSDLQLEPIDLNGDGYSFNDHFTGALRNVSNNNTYTGPLTLKTDATIGVDTGSTLTIGTKATLAGVGTITDEGNNFDLTKELTGKLVLASANTYGGLTRVHQGELNVQNANALGSGGTTANGTVVLDGAQLEIQGGITVLTELLRISGGGIDDTGALESVGGANTWAGPITLAQDPGFGPTTVPPNAVSIGVLFNAPTDLLTLTGPITDVSPLGLTKVGAGTLVLDNDTNSYRGVTTVTRTPPKPGAPTVPGTLRITQRNALGSPAAGTVVTAGAALEVAGADYTTTLESLTLNGYGASEVQSVTVSGTSGTFRLTFNGATTTALPFNATPLQVQAALNVLASIAGVGGFVNVGQATTAVGEFVYTIVFGGTLLSKDLLPLTATVTGSTTVDINTVRQGNTGALRHRTGSHTWAGPVFLQSNTSIGADPGTQLTVTGNVGNVTPTATVPSPDLTKVGTGTLVFPNANSYTGFTFVESGVLNIRNSGSLGAVVSEQQTVSLGNSTNASFTLTFRGATTAPALLITATPAEVEAALEALPTIGAGNIANVTLNGSVFTITFGGTLGGIDLPQITATGSGVTVSTATIRDGSQGTAVASGATLQLQNTGPVSTEDLWLNGSGFGGLGALQNVSGTNTWSRKIVLGSESNPELIPPEFSSVGVNDDVFIGVDVAGDRLTVNAEIAQALSGATVTKVGPGTLQYTGSVSNSYTGVTTVNQGTLELNKSSAAAVSGDLTVGDGLGAADTAIVLWHASSASEQVNKNGLTDNPSIIIKPDGLADLNGKTETIGTLKMTGGEVRLPTDSVLSLGGDVTATSSAATNEPAAITGAGELSLNGATRTFDVTNDQGTATTDLLVEADIIGTGSNVGLTKTGAGTMELTAASVSTYLGTTTIDGGVLQADGDISSSSLVDLNAGTLQGQGEVGAINATDGGLVGPGHSPGILESGDVTWDGSTEFHVDIDGPTAGDGTGNYDRLAVTGAVDLGGAKLTGAVGNGFVPIPVGITGTHMFVVIDSSGGVTGTFKRANGSDILDGETLFFGPFKFKVEYTATQVILTRIKANTSATVIEADVVLTNPATGEVTITATVKPEDGAGVGLPLTGPVEFFDNGVSLGTRPVVNGIATFVGVLPGSTPVQSNPHAPDPFEIIVKYLGDDNYEPSPLSAAVLYGDQKVTAVSPEFDKALVVTQGNPTPLKNITLTFKREVDAATIQADGNVELFDPDGDEVTITGITNMNGDGVTWLVEFDDQGDVGVYELRVDSDVTDFVGFNMDQDADGSLGEAADDQFVYKPVVNGLRVDSMTPNANTPVLSTEGVSQLRFVFNMDVGDDADGTSSLDPADVQVLGPSGNPITTGFTISGSNDIWFVTFASPLDEPGTYTVRVGPQVRDEAGGQTFQAVGNFMNQTLDANFGQPNDVFQGHFVVGSIKVDSISLDQNAPELVTRKLNGSQTINSLFINFSTSVDPGTFTKADVRLLNPSGQNVVINTLAVVAGTDDKQWKITFAPQSATGVYTVRVGPDLNNSRSEQMDQDASTPAVADAYVGGFTLNGLRVTDMTPGNPVASNNGVSSVVVTFNIPVDPANFTTDDVVVGGPGGPVAVTNIVPNANNTRFEIFFSAAQKAPGTYTVAIGPNVLDTAKDNDGRVGNPMNQDSNGTFGEAGQDVFNGTFTVAGLRVVAVDPDEVPSEDGLSSIRITFNQDVDGTTFDFADDLVLTGPNGVITPTGLEMVGGDPKVWRVRFATQSDLGDYILTVKPTIENTAGFEMDQNQNGVPGEASQDEFVGVSTVTGLRVISAKPNSLRVPPGMKYIDITFNQGVDLASQIDKVTVSKPKGAGSVNIKSVTPQGSNRVWRIAFTAQKALGKYTLKVDASLVNTAGVAMDQNGDMTPGQPEVFKLGDTYRQGFNLGKAPPKVIKGPVPSNVISFLRGDVTPLGGNRFLQKVTLFNISNRAIAGDLALVLGGLPGSVQLENRSGFLNGDPFVRRSVSGGKLESFQGVSVFLIFRGPSLDVVRGGPNGKGNYTLRLVGGT